MVELSEYVPINFICVVALGLLGVRKLVLMERFHWPRVVILTALLWLPVAYLLILGFMPFSTCCCEPLSDESDTYSCVLK